MMERFQYILTQSENRDYKMARISNVWGSQIDKINGYADFLLVMIRFWQTVFDNGTGLHHANKKIMKRASLKLKSYEQKLFSIHQNGFTK